MTIHRFEFEEKLFLVDGNSGSVHAIDQLTWDVLDFYPEQSAEWVCERLKSRYSFQDVLAAIDELEQLRQLGLLWSEMPDVPALKGEPVVKAMCLHVAHDCNLACTYCFAGQGSFGHDRSLMSLDTGKSAIDFIVSRSGARRHIEIDFFGGEPTLNFDVVKQLVYYAKDQAIQYDKILKLTLTTNGVLLDAQAMSFLNEHGVALVLSLDGRQAVNDKMRPFADGSGSYGDIVPNLKAAVASRQNQNYYVRGTYTRNNLDFAEDVLHMVACGFDQVSVEPVVAAPSEPYALRPEDLPVLRQQYRKLATAYVEKWRQGHPFNFFHFNVDLNQGPCLAKRYSGCGAGTEYVAVAPNGDIYPCHQFVGQEQWLLGNVSGDTLKEELMQSMAEAHMGNKEECKVCWAKVFCGGGCHANAYAATGSLRTPYGLGCELQRMRLEAAIAVQAICEEEAQEQQ